MSTNEFGTEVSNGSVFSIVKEAIAGSDRDFTKAPLGTAIFLLAVPMIVEMFAESLFSIV